MQSSGALVPDKDASANLLDDNSKTGLLQTSGASASANFNTNTSLLRPSGALMPSAILGVSANLIDDNSKTDLLQTSSASASFSANRGASANIIDDNYITGLLQTSGVLVTDIDASANSLDDHSKTGLLLSSGAFVQDIDASANFLDSSNKTGLLRTSGTSSNFIDDRFKTDQFDTDDPLTLSFGCVPAPIDMLVPSPIVTKPSGVQTFNPVISKKNQQKSTAYLSPEVHQDWWP